MLVYSHSHSDTHRRYCVELSAIYHQYYAGTWYQQSTSVLHCSYQHDECSLYAVHSTYHL